MPIPLVLAVLAIVFRVTRFLNADYLATPLREWADRRYGPESRVAYLLGCGWCASIWVAAIVVPVAYRYGERRWFQAAAAIAGASWLYGIAATQLDDY
ncbi:hypothetical protein [Nonomuraea recticatena]|uniref:DUF1360 domain-containing protein n=1 Tax=Nonomuraea recticatena TaxID=46178 RepID=A0ABP6E3J5_9ACTN